MNTCRCLFVFFLPSILFTKAIEDYPASNTDLIRTLQENSLRQRYLGVDSPTVENIPLFTSKRDETKWKLNYAKETLRKAREMQSLAKDAAKHFGYYEGDKQGHGVVKDMIGKAEEVLFQASEKMGYDYEKF